MLILSSSILILYIFPLGGQFKYEFQKGRVWQYPDFYSPFDFSILKSDIEYKNDQEEAVRDLKPYLKADLDLRDQVIINYSDKSTVFFKDKASSSVSDSLYTFGKKLIDEIKKNGSEEDIQNYQRQINMVLEKLENIVEDMEENKKV